MLSMGQETSQCTKGKIARIRLNGGGVVEYIGRVVNKQPHGHGKLTYRSGNTFVGNFVEGLYCGKGTLKYRSGNTFVGNFVGGVYCGKGKLSFARGGYMEGTFFPKGFCGFRKFERDGTCQNNLIQSKQFN